MLESYPVCGFNHLEKYEFVNGWWMRSHMWNEKSKPYLKTTNQIKAIFPINIPLLTINPLQSPWITIESHRFMLNPPFRSFTKTAPDTPARYWRRRYRRPRTPARARPRDSCPTEGRSRGDRSSISGNLGDTLWLCQSCGGLMGFHGGWMVVEWWLNGISWELPSGND
jgi:hypothetical protein